LSRRVVITIAMSFSPTSTRSGSPPTRAAPCSPASRRASLVSVAQNGRRDRVDDDRGARDGGGGSGRWAVALPVCDGPLARWGFARERQVRTLDGVRSITPRRACCRPCATTHVLLPAWAVPRRRDSAEVIGTALLAHANGLGHRRIAVRLGRPPGTVRGWLRRFAARAGEVGASARRWAHAFNPGELDRIGPAGSEVADAVDMLGRMARACRVRLGMSASPWELAVSLTGLLYGRPRDPPGF
jgi:hypothetical protein